MLSHTVERYRTYAEKAAQKHNVPANLLLGIINMESSGNPNALGPTTKYGRALGLGQIMPFNWRAYGGGRDWRDPEAQLDVMGRLIRNQLNSNGNNIADAVHGYFGRGSSDGYTRADDYVNRVLHYAGQAGGTEQQTQSNNQPSNSFISKWFTSSQQTPPIHQSNPANSFVSRWFE